MALHYPGHDKDWAALEAENRSNWNDRVPIHLTAYALQRLLDDPTALSTELEFDRPLLGDVAGLDLVHLQCHIGHDTLSLARLGARVTGLDFSPAAIDAARDLFARTGTSGRFVLASVYDAPAALDTTYDVVFTGVGAIVWLHDIQRWADVVVALLRPGGRLYLREGHPTLFSINEERGEGELSIEFPGFQQQGAFTVVERGTYAGDGTVEHAVSHSWNRSLAEVIQPLLDRGLVLERIAEHDTCDWRALPWMVEVAPGRWALPDRRDRLPMMFTLVARKPA